MTGTNGVFTGCIANGFSGVPSGGGGATGGITGLLRWNSANFALLAWSLSAICLAIGLV